MKDNHGHTTKVHRTDVKKIPMTEKVCQLYEEEQLGKMREGRKAVPSSKMPDLGWDIAETQPQEKNKAEETQEILETVTLLTAVPLQTIIIIYILITTIVEHLKPHIQGIPEIAGSIAQAIKSMIIRTSRNKYIQNIRKIYKTAALAITIVTQT